MVYLIKCTPLMKINMDEVKRYQLVTEFEDAEQDNTFTLALSNLKFKDGKYPNRYSNKLFLKGGALS